MILTEPVDMEKERAMNESSSAEARMARWYALTLSEQMSNIGAEIRRFIDTREKFSAGDSAEDYSEFYFNKALELIDRTESDPKNVFRRPELEDEKGELRRLKDKEVPADYILRYWDAYTSAIS